MTHIRNINTPLFPASQGAGETPRTRTASATPSGDGAHSPPSAAKRSRGTADFLASANASERTKTGIVETDIVKNLQAVMMEDYNKARASLADHILQKKSYESEAHKAECSEIVIGLVDTGLRGVPGIHRSGFGTQRKLILTRMLEKIVRDENVTYEQACDMLHNLFSSPERSLEYLTEKAQGHYNDLRKKNPGLPDVPDAFGRMALIALHKELKGYQLKDLADIACKDSNYGALLVLASGIMKQSPFASDSGGHERVEADPDLSSIKGHVQIARYKGAFRTFGAIHAHFPALKALGFLPGDILSMARHSGGSTAIQAVVTHGAALHKKGFTIDQITQIASNTGAPKNIQLALEYADRRPKDEDPRAWMVKLIGESHLARLEVESRLRRLARPVQAHVEEEMKAAEPIPYGNEGAAPDQLAQVSDGASVAVASNPSKKQKTNGATMAQAGGALPLADLLSSKDLDFLDQILDGDDAANSALEPLPFTSAGPRGSDAEAAQELRDYLEDEDL